MVRFRFKARVSLEIDDFRLSARIDVRGSDRPARPELRDRGDLAAELAAYTTPADLRDLEAVLDRYDDADTDEIRAILEGQARHRLAGPQSRWPLG